MKTIFSAIKALSFMSGFVLFWWWVASGFLALDRAIGFSLPAWTQTPGIVLMAAGGVLALACVALFIVRGRGTPAPFDAPNRFVAAGPYQLLRNPMYIGALTVLLGLGFYLRSPSILVFALGCLTVLGSLPGCEARWRTL